VKIKTRSAEYEARKGKFRAEILQVYLLGDKSGSVRIILLLISRQLEMGVSSSELCPISQFYLVLLLLILAGPVAKRLNA